MSARVRPLRIRPGARFACAGDGLCCTDVHMLGPVSAAERAAIEARAPSATVKGRRLAVLTPKADGGCTFLSSDARCRIHDEPFLPRTCARYPYLLAATPTGGRIGTDHRCPCRTVGERAPVEVASALPSLLDGRGRLSADRRIDDVVFLDDAREVPFAEYEAHEAALFARWTAEPLPRPARMSGPHLPIVERMDAIAREAPTRWCLMHAAFARGLESVATGDPPRPFDRPWAHAFERAAVRSPFVRDPEEMLVDWALDVIWALEWTFAMSFARAAEELSLRAEIARRLASTLPSRADVAMAEAIAIVEVAGLSEEWVAFVADLEVVPE